LNQPSDLGKDLQGSSVIYNELPKQINEQSTNELKLTQILKEKDIDIEKLVRSNIKAKLNDAKEDRDRNSQTSLHFFKSDNSKLMRSFDNSKSPNVFDRLSTITRAVSKNEPIIKFRKRLNNSMLE
jgi:hypothetical protein